MSAIWYGTAKVRLSKNLSAKYLKKISLVASAYLFYYILRNLWYFKLIIPRVILLDRRWMQRVNYLSKQNWTKDFIISKINWVGNKH